MLPQFRLGAALTIWRLRTSGAGLVLGWAGAAFAAYPAAGSLGANSANWAFVTDTGVLTAGFTIEGTGTKNVLIRAIGPTLSGFGVGGAWGDPILVLFAGSTPLGANDDWGAAGNVAQIVAAAQQVGGFALAAGSRDAAMLVTLQPGTYTAQVAGVGGSVGAGLVEIYEVP
ncbi:MAG: hypothetical protein FJ399_04290 [Verrucomicrobia bacterium]|nr:hypothetical protein [Verrucomicrobiota bacterium]